MNRSRIVALAACALICIVIVSAVIHARKSDRYELPIMEKAPGFELVNQHGETVRLDQLAGKIKVMSFIYARCHEAVRCPLTTKNFRKIQESLDDEYGRNTVILSITFDPESDTPGALKKYGELYGADFGNWHFLTGAKEDIDRLCEQYEIVHDKLEGPSIRHSLITFLVDQNDNIRKMYFANAWKPQEVINDVIALLD
jgi:protein SCO1/2